MDLESLPPAVDVVTAGAVLGVSRTTAYELIRTGRWPTRVLALGSRRLIPRAELLALVGADNSSAAAPRMNGALNAPSSSDLTGALDQLRSACTALLGVLDGIPGESSVDSRRGHVQ